METFALESLRGEPQGHALSEAEAFYHKAERPVYPGRYHPPLSYKQVLLDADAFFAKVMSEQPQNLQCGRGCSLCCYGLFEIGSGDLPVLAEGLARLHPARRKKIVRRAQEIIDAFAHPNLRECSPEEKEEFFERTAGVACPALSEIGECEMYESRPLVCRTFGLPLREGDRYVGDICELNFTEAGDGEKLRAAWDLMNEDVLGPEDEYTIPEAIVLAARLLGAAGDPGGAAGDPARR